VKELETRHSLELELAVELAKKTVSQQSVERSEQGSQVVAEAQAADDDLCFTSNNITFNNETFDDRTKSCHDGNVDGRPTVDLAAVGSGRGVGGWNPFEGGSPKSSSASPRSSHPSSPSSAQRRRARRPLPPAASGGRNGLGSPSRGSSSSSSSGTVNSPPVDGASSAYLDENRSCDNYTSSDLQRDVLLRQLYTTDRQRSGAADAAEPSTEAPASSGMATPTTAGSVHGLESLESPLLTLAKRSLAKRPRNAAAASGDEGDSTPHTAQKPMGEVVSRMEEDHELTSTRSFLDIREGVAKPFNFMKGLGRLLRWGVVLCLCGTLCCGAAAMLGLVLGGSLKFTAAMQRSRLQPKPLSPLGERLPPSSTVLLAAGEWVPSPFRTALLLGHDGALRVLQVMTRIHTLAAQSMSLVFHYSSYSLRALGAILDSHNASLNRVFPGRDILAMMIATRCGRLQCTCLVGVLLT